MGNDKSCKNTFNAAQKIIAVQVAPQLVVCPKEKKRTEAHDDA
ncbi:hypothetical protein [Fibrobacter sp. UBA4297]|nr:hypothetical protein [Fibrobacter sp. UBA4297]